MWLAFCDEGLSLHALMYGARADSAGGPRLLEPSAWWWQLRRGPGGEGRLRGLIRQSLLALRALHAANVTHRRALCTLARCASTLCFRAGTATGCTLPPCCMHAHI
jgi:hypothetical protein